MADVVPNDPLATGHGGNPGTGAPARRHTLSDWLELHELDPATCRRTLDAMPRPELDAGIPQVVPQPEDPSFDREAAWLSTREAMRDLLIEQQSIIDDTFEQTGKIVVVQPEGSRKALTLDNGPEAYPTILYSYRGDPADCLVVAHEFAHALQIRASRGQFVTPVMREVCAFVGEMGLLSHTLERDAPRHSRLRQAWQQANSKYFGEQKDRLQAALQRPGALYKYSWNYPIARYVAMQITERGSRDLIWSAFQGEVSLREALRELDLA